MGGATQPDYKTDERALRAIRAALEMGYSHIDTAEMYANGHTEELVGQVIRDFPRQSLFITTKVRPPNLAYKKVLQSVDGSLRRLGVDWIDLYLVHWLSGSYSMEEIVRALNQVVREGKVRYLGVSNFDLGELKRACELSETRIITNQVPYSLASRQYIKNGVIPYCQDQGIIVTAYSPVEEGRLRANPKLAEIARDHRVTPYQVAITWLVQQPWVITIPMSQNVDHLRQNLQSADIELSVEEMGLLNDLHQSP
jgi:diketogulonate reductase-like aldo/keto reductase